ncbi:glycosyltransferase family 2 protein [Dolichospermum sp. ST_sed1]|nr:glycosyltransferase family 2 protein [Dolichospermum sp. ST_sed1]
MADSIPISAVVLAHNEADNLPRCLRALGACAEVVVVDDGSTDGSPRIASECGARVVVHPFVSFADQRNWAMDFAGLKQDWVLHLDADEVMTPAALEEIRRRLPAMATASAGFLARKVMLEEKWLRYSADYPVYVPRLLHRRGGRYVRRGHGDVLAAPPAASVFLEEPLLHYNFSKGWPEWRARHLRYAEAEAARIRSGAAQVSFRALISADRLARRAAWRALSYRLPGRPVLRFLYAYVFRLGFLDGWPGLRFCLAMAEYETMINAALRKPAESGIQ